MRAPTPRVLFAASIVLSGAFALGVVLTHRRAPTQPTLPAHAHRPPPTLLVRPQAFSAAVSWRGDPTARVEWGPAGMAALLQGRGVNGAFTLPSLAPNALYHVTVAGVGATTFATSAIPSVTQATTAAGAVDVDGEPLFPLISWQECPNRWPIEIRQGINLFGGNACTGLANLLTAVAGRALVAGTPQDEPGVTGPGLVGWFLADEADARGLSAATLPPPGGGGLRFLTLTSHFFAQAAPLPTGRGMYPGLVAKADVVGFDLYPLQELCRPDVLPWIFDAQSALRAVAPGKPTFQWIEDRVMGCPQTPVTPATIRVESWLAIAGGATGLAFFPNQWTPQVGAVIHGIAMRIRQLEPALLTAPLPVTISPAEPDVRGSTREFGGVRYVIAVNAGSAAARVRIDGMPTTLPPLSVRLLLPGERSVPLG